MKKIVLLVAVLMIAAPTMAAVDIKLAETASGPFKVSVSYDASGETELPRAFALNISCSAGPGQITAISGYKWGESVSSDKGFGVFMGSIDYDNLVSDPTNASVWGSPRATDAGAASTDALPQSAITVEMGSLYDPGTPADAPNAGTGASPIQLLEITVNGECTVTVTPNTSRGADTGVRLESGAEASMTSTPIVLSEGPQYPACWDSATQCHGDSDGNGTVNTSDWPDYRDGFLASYPSADYLSFSCADYNKDGVINTSDWPVFRDNFLLSPPANCTTGDPLPVY